MQLAGLLLWPARFRARIKAAGRRTATVAAAFSQIMNGRFAGADADAPAVARSPAGGKYERLIDYYESAGPDFEEWSPTFNMHFGFYRRGANPFRREPMLEEMNRQVLDRLGLARDREHVILDLGCGVGATVRYAAVMFPLARILGLTVVPWQVAKGNAWNLRLELYPRANLELADYTRTGRLRGWCRCDRECVPRRRPGQRTLHTRSGAHPPARCSARRRRRVSER